MNGREKRIRIIDLQNQYCRGCEYHTGPPTYCMDSCEIGKELIKLNKKIFGGTLERKDTSDEKWDKRCEQAIDLYERGMEYPVIAKQVGCHVSGLYRELKKRGLLKMPKKMRQGVCRQEDFDDRKSNRETQRSNF
ncbi:zinc-finger domain-containing protein [Bacillus cereus]|uniref:Cobalamin biosynthesis protein n=1 Tax=Bacillus cereus VD184 TaxID=1053242 RepID=A0A9W5VPH0_BACCE|nr:zinc-finger domain-containing protein [Bacillus cereus]EOQ01276.1 hypothetical protein IKC_06534 [Bacillus cereus VD184]